MCWQQCSATRPASRAGPRKKLIPGAASSRGHFVAGSLLVSGLTSGLSIGPGCLSQNLFAAGSLLSTGLSDGVEGVHTIGRGLGSATEPGMGSGVGGRGCAGIDDGNETGIGNGMDMALGGEVALAAAVVPSSLLAVSAGGMQRTGPVCLACNLDISDPSI